MSRTTTAAQANALAAPRRLEFARVFVENADGIFVDYTALAGHNWFRGASIDVNLDQPISQATIKLNRSHGVLSLSPLRSDSTLNRDAGGNFVPALDVGRGVYVEVAILDPAVAGAPIGSDWIRLWEGTTDTVDVADQEIVMTGRDAGGRLADLWLPGDTALIVEGDPAMSLEAAIQALIDTAIATFGPGSEPVTLYTPVASGVGVTRFGYHREPLMDAIQRLVDTFGWSCRYLYDATSGTFRLTLFKVDRAKVVPDLVLGPNRYTTISKLNLTRTMVRNQVLINFTDSFAAGGPVRSSVSVEDAASQFKYGGVRPIVIDEASDSAINTPAEATAMATALLADLKDPKAEQETTLPLLWPVELADLIRFSANDVHQDGNLDLAVSGIRHTLEPNKLSTTMLSLRGTPAGSYKSWLYRARRGSTAPPSAETIAPPIALLSRYLETDSTITLALSGSLGHNGTGPLEFSWRLNDGLWSAWSTAHGNLVIAKLPKLTQVAQLQVRQADGQISAPASFAITGALPAVNTGTGQVDPTQPLSGTSHFIPRATDVNGMILDPGSKEAQGKELRRLFAKPLFGDPDTLDANIDGLLYGRPKLTALTGGEVDLSKAGVINRHLGNIADGGGFNRVAAADMSGNRVAILHVGDTRNTNAPPSSYSQGVTNEFKDAGAIGIPGFAPASGVFGNLRTEKPWSDSSGGYATQTWAGSDGRVWKREGPAGGASWPNPWRILTEVQTQRFDRATGHLTDDMQTSGGREVRRLLAKGLAADPDTLDATGLDGLNFKRTTVTQVGYADRAGVGLDSSGYLQSGVRTAATVAGLSAALLSRRSGALFVETYDVLPQNNGWAISGVGGWSAVLQSDTNSTMGRNCLITSNYTVQSWGTPIPINPNKLYRLRVRARTIQYHAEGAANTVWYIGVIASDYAGNAANANSGACYCVAESANPGLGGFVEYVGWMKGCTTPYATTSGLAGGTAAAPAAWNVGTVAIQPYILAGYPNGGAGIGGQFMVDYFLIDEFDEDGTFRTYRGLSEGGDVKGLLYTPSGSRRIVRGGKSGFCRHGDVVVFPATTNLPAVILEGGVQYQPESKWSSATGVDTGTGPFVAPTAGKAQYRDFFADNLTNSSFTVRARLRIKGGTGTANYDYPANSVSSVGYDTGAVTLAAGPSSNGQYTTRFDITVNCTCLATSGTATYTVTLAVEVDDGSGSFTERLSFNYAASADAGTGAQSSVNTNQAAVVSAAVSGVNGRIRIRVKDATLTGVKGSGSFTLHGHVAGDTGRGVSYSTSAGDQYTSATPDVDDGSAITYTVVEL
ncbi:MAG TPA: hypothetical protein VFZ00_27250 [Solirubrobacter sp.]|nr:hypothetical protein [Solirubrobacter sp.]